MGLNNREQKTYSEGRTEHLLFLNLFPCTVQVSPLLVYSVLQTVRHLLFLSPVLLCKLIRHTYKLVRPTFNREVITRSQLSWVSYL